MSQPAPTTTTDNNNNSTYCAQPTAQMTTTPAPAPPAAPPAAAPAPVQAPAIQVPRARTYRNYEFVRAFNNVNEFLEFWRQHGYSRWTNKTPKRLSNGIAHYYHCIERECLAQIRVFTFDDGRVEVSRSRQVWRRHTHAQIGPM